MTRSALAPPAPPPDSVRIILSNTPRAPEIARGVVGRLLLTMEHPRLVEDAELCTSEAVTNAHLHTRTPLIAVDVTIARQGVTVAVHDNRVCPLPEPREWYSEQEYRRGLFLLDRVADAWGSTMYFDDHRSPRSKAVWFTLHEKAVA